MIAVYDSSVIFCFLAFRGLYLWLLIPAAFLGWLFVHAWRQKSSYGACLGWYDWNLFVFFATGLVGARLDRYARGLRYVKLVDMSKISHRVGRMVRTLQKVDSDASRFGM